VIEHRIGGDEGNANAPAERGQRGDARAIVAAIGMPRRKIDARADPKRLLDAP
jgi:hypothetical protein